MFEDLAHHVDACAVDAKCLDGEEHGLAPLTIVGKLVNFRLDIT